MGNSYVVVEITQDGDYQYFGTCVVTLDEGEEPSEEVLLKALYWGDDTEVKYDEWCKGWVVELDYRIVRIYNWTKIESEEHKQILNKYGVQ